ncbi:Transcriptional regulator OS=Streptomyces antimycoticus OX=68175 GN=SANT12839_045700 PE=4 SV=1 [Streptomyces antimycoticus]
MDGNVPAYVYGPAMDILAWNRLGTRLCIDYPAIPEERRNGPLLVFLDPRLKEIHPNWAEVADDTVAGLRAEVGRHPGNSRVCRVTHELLERSEEFRRRWEAQEVQERTRGVKRFRHPEMGELVLRFEAFVLPADPGQMLCTYTADEGSATAEALKVLAGAAAVA